MRTGRGGLGFSGVGCGLVRCDVRGVDPRRVLLERAAERALAGGPRRALALTVTSPSFPFSCHPRFFRLYILKFRLHKFGCSILAVPVSTVTPLVVVQYLLLK